MRDTLIDYARNVMIPLQNQVGRYAKVHLYFDSKWMMISEMEFTSEVAVGNFTPEALPTTRPPVAAQVGGESVHEVAVSFHSDFAPFSVNLNL